MSTSTSFRISETAKTILAERAAAEGTSATAMLDRLIVEGVTQLDYPGIIFRGPAHDRRAALAAGPDVWEIVSRLQELDGAQEHRINVLAEESGLHPRLVRLALDYAAERSLEIRERIKRNKEAIARSQAAVGQREKLLAA